MKLPNPPPPCSRSRVRRRAWTGRTRLPCIALLAALAGGCCTRPEQPKEILVNLGGFDTRLPNGRYFGEWQRYEDCLAYANLMIFGLLASTHSNRYDQEPRSAPPSSGPPAPPAGPPGGD